MSFILEQARRDVYRVCQGGQTLSFPAAATYDEFGEPLTNSTVTLRAFPVRFTPFNRTITSNVSWSSEVDMIAFVSHKEFIDAGYILERFQDTYKRVTLNGQNYDVKYINEYMAHADSYLYLIIGAKR